VIRDEATAKRPHRHRVEAKSAFHASLKELEKVKESADDWRDRLEELQRSTGFLVDHVAAVAAVAEDVVEASTEGTLGSLPAGRTDEPETNGAEYFGVTSTIIIFCVMVIQAGTLGSRGAVSRNEPNVPGPVGSIVPPVSTPP
jgi:hypothetical protein